MTAARGVSGDVSATATGRKAGREKAGQANEAQGFATAMRGLGSGRDEKNTAPASATTAKPADRSALQAGRQGDFARRHETATIDRGEGKAEARLAGRFADTKDAGAGVVAEEGGVTAGRKKPAQGASGDKRGTTIDANTPVGTDQGDVGTAENPLPKAKAEATRNDVDAAATRGRRGPRTDAPIKPVAAAKEGAPQVEGAQDPEAMAASDIGETKNAEPGSSGDGAPAVDAKGRPRQDLSHERIIAERDPELRRLRILQSGVGAENPAVELQLSAEDVAKRLGILLPGDVDETSQDEVVPAPPRSGRVIVTVGRGGGYAVDPVEQDEASLPARGAAEARSSAPLSPDAKLAAILGGFGLESKIVAATAAEPESRPSEIDQAAASGAAARQAGGNDAMSAAAARLPNAEQIQVHDGSETAGSAKSAVSPTAANAAPGAAKPTTAETSPEAAATPAAADRASFVVPERGVRAVGASDPLSAGRAAAATSQADAAGKASVSAGANAASPAVDAPRMTTVRLPEQPGSSRSLGLGARVDLVSMRTDFEPATRRSERGGVGDAPAGRTGPSLVEAGNSAGAASARGVLASLDEVLSTGSIASRPSGLDAGVPAAPAASAGGEGRVAGGREAVFAADVETASAATPRSLAGETKTAFHGASPELPSQAVERRDLGDRPTRQTSADGTLSPVAPKGSAEPGFSRAAESSAQGASQPVVAASPDGGSALPADRPAPTVPFAAKVAADGGAMAPASSEPRGGAAQIQAPGPADGKATASIGAKDAVVSKSSEAPSVGMPARAPVSGEAGGTTGLPASRSAEPSAEGRQMPIAGPSAVTAGENNAAVTADDGQAQDAGARRALASAGSSEALPNRAFWTRQGTDPVAAGVSHQEAMTTAPRPQGAAEAGAAPVARHQRVSAGTATSSESGATRPDAGTAVPRHDESVPFRQMDGATARIDTTPGRAGRNAPVAGQDGPVKTATSTMAQGAPRGATATGEAATASTSASAAPAPADRPAQASPTTRIRDHEAAAATPSAEPKGQPNMAAPSVQPQAAAATTMAPRTDRPLATEPSQGMETTKGEAIAEPLRQTASMMADAKVAGDRGQGQQQQPRTVDRPAAAMPFAEPKGQPNAAMPAAPDAQLQSAATTTMAARTDRSLAAEPSRGMENTNGEAIAEPLRRTASMMADAKEAGDRGQRQQQQPRAVDRPAAAMPTDEPKGSASRTMPAAPGAQPQAASTTTMAARMDRPLAAGPSQGAGDTSAGQSHTAASTTVPATETADRGPRSEQQPRVGEKPGMAPFDDLVRSKPVRQTSSQTVRSEDGAVAASRQGMLSASTAQVADALATALVKMDPAANAPVGADRTRLRAGGAALKTIQIQLAPEKLGKVNVTLKLIGGNLAVHIEASEPETAHRLKDDAEGLKSLLKSAGFDVDEAVVTVGARDAAGSRAAHQPGAQGDASASGQARGEGSANGGFASDGQTGQGDRREDGRPRRPQAGPGARSFDGTADVGGRKPAGDPSIYL